VVCGGPRRVANRPLIKEDGETGSGVGEQKWGEVILGEKTFFPTMRAQGDEGRRAEGKHLRPIK